MKFFKPVAGVLIFLLPAVLSAAPKSSVGVSEDQYSYTLTNGIVAARVSKRSGDLTSLRYKGLELLDTSSARSFGYWSHDTSRGERTTRIAIDPMANGGERGEVSVKGISNGNPMGNGPGGSVIADIEIRYALGRDDSGVYTYSIFTHPTNYPATTVGEARFCAKLNDNVFDWMTVDANRNMKMITTYDWNHGTQMNMKEARLMNSGLYKGMVEHKYDYSANQFDVRAWGWSSSERHVGLWFVNPSVEYLSGGPTKVELSAHRDATFNTNALNAPAPPTLLNYWRGSHYGGSICSIAQTDAWTKVIGPFLIYCNAAQTHDAMWKDALAKAKKESAAWPYDWVSGVDYPHKSERAVVSGQFVLNDPQLPKIKMANLLVGLSAPDYTPARANRNFGGFGGFGLGGGGDDDTNSPNQSVSASDSGRSTNDESNFTNNVNRFGTNVTGNSTNQPGGRRRSGRRGAGGGGPGFGGFGPRTVDWQNDAKYYEFWVRGDARGNFTIPNVRPGIYTLHAITDGVLGEFAVSNITVTAGQALKLGRLNWQPVRHGKQLWDIGIPNRNASEFFKGDDYFHWGWYLEYAKLFPNDVNYVVGQSDYRKDWFFEQVPHNNDPADTTGRSRGESTTWSINFNLPDSPKGRATLQLAICGVGTRSLEATVNDHSVGSVTGLVYNATINRDGIGGSWTKHKLAFDASVMKAGGNVMKLTIPAGGLTSGVMYDYLRLELDETAPPK
jgi:rhamnogalacturonan endolyase